MKKLYEFTVNKEETVDETIVNEDGSKTIRAIKKEVPQKFFLRKPTRSLHDESEVFSSVQVSECIRRGCITQSLLLKRIANDGGARSEDEKTKYATLYTELFEKQQAFQKESLKRDEDRTPEDKVIYTDLVKSIATITEELQKLEFNQVSLFDQTAEAIARNKTIRWWILMLSYSEKDGKESPVFGDGTFEEKLKAFDDMEEGEDPFAVDVLRRLIMYVSFWFCGRANKQEDFEKLTVV
jgi:hypothetical protein